MGNVDKDTGFGFDRSKEHPDRITVRITLGHGAGKYHRASPELRRNDVLNLWRCTRGRAAIPDCIAVWWRQQDEEDRTNVLLLLRGLGLLTWIAVWLQSEP